MVSGEGSREVSSVNAGAGPSAGQALHSRPGPPQRCPRPQPPGQTLVQGLLWETWMAQEERHRGADMGGGQGAAGSPHYSTMDPKFYQAHLCIQSPINS